MTLNNRTIVSRITTLAAVSLTLIGCSHTVKHVTGIAQSASSTPVVAAKAPVLAQKLTLAQLRLIKPNEDGMVPIFEYHNIFLSAKNKYTKTVAQFKAELNKLYDANYLPISMHSYLDNAIDLPAGKSPVILSFDDADESQFKYLANGKIDPDCAVGIMLAFHKLHPVWKLRGIFFVLPTDAFGQAALASKKLQSLLAMGFEIGNHTITHPHLSQLSDTKVQWEMAQNVADIKKLAPAADDDVLALPYGIFPRNRQLTLRGTWKNLSYHNRAVMLVGAEPAPAVIDKKFKAIGVPRVQPVTGPFGMDFWLSFLRHHPGDKYVSDGDPNTTTIPKSRLADIIKSRLNGSTLRVY